MRSPEDKALYRSHVFKLAQGRAIPVSQTEFWLYFWTQPESTTEIFSAASIAEWRTIRDQNPVNVYTLLVVLFRRIVGFNLSNAPNLNQASTKLLNCIRLVTRVLPVLYGSHEYASVYEFQLFWNEKDYDPVDLIDKDKLASASTTGGPYNTPEKVFGVTIVRCLVDLLFVRGFTMSRFRSDTLWEKGISGSSSSHSHSNSGDSSTAPIDSIVDCNRSEVLKLILTLFSSTMYQKLEDVTSENNNFLLLFITSCPKQKLLDLTASLLNIVCRSGSNSSSTNGLDFSTQEQLEARHICVVQAAQLLTLMTVFPIRDSAELITNFRLYSASKPYNMVRVFLGNIKSETDLTYLANSLMNIILQPLALADSTNYNFQMGGRTIQPAPWVPNVIMLTWELLQCNSRLRAIIAKKHAPKLLIGLTYNTITFWNASHHSNLVRVSLFFMLYLSAELKLIASIFRPLSRTLYESLPRSFHLPYYPQSTRDFLIVHLCRTLTSAFPQQTSSPSINNNVNTHYHTKNTMTDSILTTIVEILYNLIPCVSPIAFDQEDDPTKRLSNYNKDGGLAYTTSCELILLLDKLSNRQFLLAKPLHIDLLALLVRVTCVVGIKYPQQSRMHLYAMKKNQKSFINIQTTMNSFSSEYFKGNLLRIISDTVGTPISVDATSPTVRTTSTLNNLENSVDVMPSLSRTASHRSDQMSITSSQYIQDSEINEALFIQSLNRQETNYTRSNSIYSSTIIQQEENRELLDDDLESLVVSEDEVVDEALHPRLPIGMSKDAREKLPIDAPLKKVWAGNEPLKIITTIILPYFETPSTTATVTVPIDGYTWINDFDLTKFSKAILQYKTKIPLEYLSDTPLEPLEFLWSHISLGWYISIVWSNIYNTNHNVKTYISQNQNIMNSLSTGLASLGKWTGLVKQKVTNEYVPLEWTRKSLTTINHWFGTEIKLFKVNEALNDGIFGAISSKLTNITGGVNGNGDSPTLFRKLNESRQRNGSHPTIIEDTDTRLGRQQRNSLTSLHSLNTLNRSRASTPRNSMCI
ncbi:uncharacterized protein KQ657_002113 [Scheffersomyces spartinae]|uniref:Protein HID1 n=1 Tax=Scheffersomyces spartinae TaxID=45513 RepID=A0A9P7VCT9_9ASCO|nr:uncharacterized protein KQ657_002113 [Scheffersomyces spartinae]KAG7195730.1 hypothetical protein KQ657_002113 [Scheffersomyces spartinae]